ncbi:MAG TPA: hypothetical protein VJZ78_05495 [Anaerolineales bacterium]|nr:hypothetical protein [Anaerolineales bacterium]
MKKGLNIFGILFVIVGFVFILQGVNILPGSFMTGQIQWAWYGGITALVGIVFLILARSKK